MAYRSRSLRLMTVAVGLLLLGPAVTAQAATRQAAPVTVSVWAGYVAHSAAYSSVTSTWAEPAVSCGSAESSAAFWVGIDGYSDATVEQIGTEAHCVGGVAAQDAWYEVYPAAPVYVSRTVEAGDVMTATVTATTADVFTLSVKNATEGWTFTTTKTVTGAARSSAEVVLEAPSTAAARAGTVSFSNARVNGGTLAASDPTGIGIGTGAGPHCGAISAGGTAFTCTW